MDSEEKEAMLLGIILVLLVFLIMPGWWILVPPQPTIPVNVEAGTGTINVSSEFSVINNSVHNESFLMNTTYDPLYNWEVSVFRFPSIPTIVNFIWKNTSFNETSPIIFGLAQGNSFNLFQGISPQNSTLALYKVSITIMIAHVSTTYGEVKALDRVQNLSAYQSGFLLNKQIQLENWMNILAVLQSSLSSPYLVW